MTINVDFHRVLSMSTEDKVIDCDSPFSVRVTTLIFDTGEEYRFGIYADRGSALDAEIRAAVGKAQEAA